LLVYDEALSFATVFPNNAAPQKKQNAAMEKKTLGQLIEEGLVIWCAGLV